MKGLDAQLRTTLFLFSFLVAFYRDEVFYVTQLLFLEISVVGFVTVNGFGMMIGGCGAEWLF